jgi:hypothetical protein
MTWCLVCKIYVQSMVSNRGLNKALASPVSEHCIGLVLESGRRPRWCG